MEAKVPADYFACARYNMIEQQVRPWNIQNDRIMDVMASILRHDFALPEWRELAYTDMPLPLNEHSHMLEPKIVARMLQAALPLPTDKALEIGTGSGYMTACLTKLTTQVESFELDSTLVMQAQRNLAGAKADNTCVHQGDGLKLPTADSQRYNLIIINGAVATYDHLLGLQGRLAVGGRLIGFVNYDPWVQMVRITRHDEVSFYREDILETQVEMLKGAEPKPEFVF